MRTINDEWEDYLNNVIPKNATETQIKNAHQSFIAGAARIVALLNSHSEEECPMVLEHLLSVTEDPDVRKKLLAARNRE